MRLLTFKEVVSEVKCGLPRPILTVVRDKKRIQGGWDACWCTKDWNYLADWLKTDEKKGYGTKWVAFIPEEGEKDEAL